MKRRKRGEREGKGEEKEGWRVEGGVESGRRGGEWKEGRENKKRYLVCNLTGLTLPLFGETMRSGGGWN